MTEVRRHQRQTASGKTTTVRQHHRDTGGGDAARAGWAQRVESSRALHVSALQAGEPEPAAEEWWDDSPQEEPAGESRAFLDMQQEMRDWRALPEPEPGPAEPMTPQMEKLLGRDTPEGRARMDRLRAYREAGYAGPLDQDERIPDPDDPANWEWMRAGAAMRKHSG
jgi:hypothetical protein